MFSVCTQGTEEEQRAHSQQSVNDHLEMSVEHTAQTELDVVRLRGQTEVPVCIAYMSKSYSWWRGVAASVVRRMNEVTLRRAMLVLGWVTVFGRVYHHVEYQLRLG